MGFGLQREVNRCIYPEGYSRITINYDITNCGGGVSGELNIIMKMGIMKDREIGIFIEMVICTLYIINLGPSEDKTRIYFKENGEIEKLL